MMSHLSTAFTSTKALYRPGKLPTHTLHQSEQHRSKSHATSLKRNDSAVSLPSPPDERRIKRRRSVELEVDDGPRAGVVRYLGSDQGEGAGDASNKNDTFASSSSHPTVATSASHFDHISPTQHSLHIRKQRRVAKEKIQFDLAQKSNSAKDRVAGMGDGWKDENNPFIDHSPSSPSKKKQRTPGGAVCPEKMTYVFRGKRITYDVPLSALLSPEDPTSSPFPIPSPRLLFPSPPPLPTTPPTGLLASFAPPQSFLDALRLAKRAPEREKERERSRVGGLLSPDRSPVRKRRDITKSSAETETGGN